MLPKLSALSHLDSTESIERDFQKVVKLNQEIEKNLRESPAALLAQTFFFVSQNELKKETDKATQWLCKVVFFIHLCKSNRFNETSCIILASAFLLTQFLCNRDMRNHRTRLDACKKLLKSKGYQAGLDLIAISPILTIDRPILRSQRLKLRDYQWFALSVTQLLVSRPTNTWQQRIFQLFSLTPNWIHPCLEAILSWPSTYLPGHIVTVNQINQVVILPKQQQLAVWDGRSLKCVGSETCYLAKQKTIGERAFFSTLDSALSKYEPPNLYAASFPLTRPPNSLINILKQCQTNKLDIAKLVNSVEREPRFSNFIVSSATQSNRLNIPVNSVKQAVMTYGTERLGDMLTTHALYERFNQNNFPLKADFTHHLSLSSALGSTIVEISAKKDANFRTKLLPQTVSLLCLFSHCALFSTAALKHLSHWHVSLNKKDVRNAHEYTYFFPFLSLEQFRIPALKLARAWSLTPANMTILDQVFKLDLKKTHAAAAAIKLSTLWALQCKSGIALNKTTFSNEAKLLKVLGLTIDDKITCLESNTDLIFCRLSQ